MAEWLANINQQQYGPVDETTLQSWVTQGRLGPGDLIWSQGMAQWVQAVTVFPNWFGQNPPPLTGGMSAPGMPGGAYATPTTGVKPHRGTMILVFGILGIVCCFIFGIVAWVMGNGDLREMREGRMDPSGQGTTNGGRICGIIAVVLFIVQIVIGLAGGFSNLQWNMRM